MLGRSGAAKLPDARKFYSRVNTQSAENFLVAGEHVSKSGELAGGHLREGHATRAAARAVTQRGRLEHKDGTPGGFPALSAAAGLPRLAPGRSVLVIIFARHSGSRMRNDFQMWGEF